jgi:hypothetical protein
MSRSLMLWLAIKRLLQVGWFSTIIADKCDSHWTDVECPAPPTWREFHRGQFGHKVAFFYCDKCLIDHEIREKGMAELGFGHCADRTREKI